MSDTLGHSDTRITRDIYQSVLPHVGKSAAEATAKLVPLQRKAEAEKARKAAKKAKPGKGHRPKERRRAQGRSGRSPARRHLGTTTHVSLSPATRRAPLPHVTSRLWPVDLALPGG
ncbi:hypothetical protein GCM10017779_15220 [Streptomyces capillispiralis]|nr:hypothetical protein GCM10017779_15220 [Streptomyces capillispiralis]